MNINPLEIKLKPTIFSKENLRLLALILLTIVSILIISLASNDSSSIYNSTLLYTVLILFFVFIVFIYIINAFDHKSKGYIYIFSTIVFCSIIGIFIAYNVGLANLLTNDYVTNILLFIIVIIGVAIFYFLLLDKFVNRPGWLAFMIKFIFYIPCTFVDGIRYLIQDFSTTSSFIIKLLFIEFLFIIIYLYFYPRLKKSVYDNGLILLKNPVPLNKEMRIDAEFYKSFINKKPEPGATRVTLSSPIRETYSLSMWIYLNIQPSSQLSYTTENIIFSYLDTSGNGHPTITYNNIDGIDTYYFYLSETTVYKKVLPHQKWNNIVLNYRDLYVDIFINGNLEKSIELNERPMYTNRDIITVGENSVNQRSGLYGSICNVAYYKNIMTKGQIIDNYNLLSINNPPVF
jgi:hypothetical protein